MTRRDAIGPLGEIDLVMMTDVYDHVIFVSIDTLRSDAIRANPIPLWPAKYRSLKPPDTSVLDELAAEGAFLVNTISSAPYTSASHATFFTGRYPLAHGVYEFYNGRIEVPTVFTIAAGVGRRTILKTDFPIILGPELGFTQGVDTYLVEDDDGFIDAVLCADQSVSFVHFGGVHLPYGFHNLRFGGAAYRAKIDELEAEVPADVPEPADQLTETFRDAEDHQLLLRYKRVFHHLYAAGCYDKLFELYLEGVEHFLRTRFQPFLDRLRGRLRAAGKTSLLVIFGDHGHEFDDDSCGHFNSLAEGVVRVPVILVGDGIAPGLVCVERTRSVDVLPTVLELSGLGDGQSQYDGRSLAGVLRGEEPPARGLPALVQAHTSDARDFVQYQQRQLAGVDPGPLKHILLGEVAYLGDRRLTRVHFRYRDGFTRVEEIDETIVHRFDGQQVPHVDDAAETADLIEALAVYNSGRRAAEPVIARMEIQEGLRAMGYRV